MKTLSHRFLTAEPFPHLVIDDFLPPCAVRAAHAEFAALPDEAWHVYDGRERPDAGKRACRDWAALAAHAPTCHLLLRAFTSSAAARLAAELTGLDDLLPDPELYGGGLHAMAPGSSLGLHLDNELHPTTSHVRRLNLIVYLNDLDPLSEHNDRFGGRLQLWDRQRRRPVAEITPRKNLAVLMETCAHAYHAVSPSAAAARERRSLAVYYWSPPRRRAQFVAASREAP